MVYHRSEVSSSECANKSSEWNRWVYSKSETNHSRHSDIDTCLVVLIGRGVLKVGITIHMCGPLYGNR